VKEELVEEMEQRLGAQEVSLDGRFQTDGEDGRSLAEILADGAPSPEEQIGEVEFEELRKQSLYKAMTQLSERERLIIHRRRLIDKPETLNEIGKILGITRERVRQLEARAICKLRSYLIENPQSELMMCFDEVSEPQPVEQCLV
jgi:RNA polymerase sigma-32 factor